MPRPVQALKQVFDINALFDRATDMGVVNASYNLSFDVQQRARRPDIECTREQALDDVVDAAGHIAALQLNDIQNFKTLFFDKGVQTLDFHLVGENFTRLTAQTPAARAALTATLLKTGQTNIPFEKIRQMPSIADIGLMKLTAPWDRFLRLRKVSPEAFFRWSQVASFAAGNANE